MQLEVSIGLREPLALPINYNHIIQSIIYRALNAMPDYSEFLHECGYTSGSRQYRMFQFSQLNGDYYIDQKQRNIVFCSYVHLEIRSPEPLLIRLLAMNIKHYGISFGSMVCHDVHLKLYDYTVEDNSLDIRMKSPITVYSTNSGNGYVTYYRPDEDIFYQKINDNFRRKYQAYYGLPPSAGIEMKPLQDSLPKKMVTRYQGSYITAWYGIYQLTGGRKYLDFLYQTGLGGKNSQGFGMFEIL